METYLNLLDMCYFEVSEAFKELPDDHVWKRPAAGLLSVGELAGHVAYWEAVKFGSEGMDGKTRDLSKCLVKSLLIDDRFAYFPTTIETPPSEEHLAMTAKEVFDELNRVHSESMNHFKALDPPLDDNPAGWSSFWTYREFLKYACFHISYHTGQMYTARHLLGETTPDN